MMQATATQHTAPNNYRDMANAIRTLSMDAVEQAKSGHPGMPMGMADVATVLFAEHLKFDPQHANWPDRDRFVLSAGHGSMLQYALLYLTGYPDMGLDDIKNFRQLGAKTAGHPEFGHASGIETTTGPLGQGLTNAVGMALAERMLAARFGEKAVDHYTYVIAGDGCLMEGISQEAISLAGHLKLNKLIVLWDDNKISIDGPTSLTTSEDMEGRFKAAGWNVHSVDGHDTAAVSAAITKAKNSDLPTMIACNTTIGYGAPSKAGKSSSHGAPLGADEIKGAREALGWSHGAFEIPDDVLKSWRDIGARGAADYDAWSKAYGTLSEADRTRFERVVAGELPAEFNATLNALKKSICEEKPAIATRKASENTLNAFSAVLPELAGGSADLTGSNNTKTKNQLPVQAGDYAGGYIYYGVREHAMASMMNGMALHGGFIPYGGTFMVFTDYCRPAIRLSALMEQRVIYVMTHDSIGLGEDGPTHQPVEHLAALRAIPNLQVFRPADAIETAECWALALASSNRPSILSLTRQNLPTVRTEYTADNPCARGGYVLADADNAKVTLIASGSEIEIAMDAQNKLSDKGIAAKVVSLPCWELFDAQPASYREETLGKHTVRIAIEAASGFGWERYTGDKGAFVGMKGFGASAPAQDLYKHFGITADAAVAAAENCLSNA